MNFHHLKEQLKQIVGARRGARPGDDPEADDRDAAEAARALEREIDEAFGIRRDADQERTD